MSLAIGQGLHQNRYRIDGLLGQGGMGAVYRAWDLSLDVPVAIKENLEASPEAQNQFIREAQILARLSHPNLPRVTNYFFISSQGQYLVMDYVEGEDLDQMLSRLGVLPEEQALEWILQVSEALDYLHNQPTPIIHRDIKPANVKIHPDGRAMLVDFGIAKVFDPNRPTTAGARAVTPGYSPPEQYGGGRTDARSDVYALGATLYRMLTGQAPPESVQRMTHTAWVTPPRQFNPQIRPATEQVILKAIEITPDHRFHNIAEFTKALTSPQPPDASMATAPSIKRTALAPRPAHIAPQQVARPIVKPARVRAATPPPKPAANRALQILLGVVGFLGITTVCVVLLFVSGLLDEQEALSLFTGGGQPTDTAMVVTVEALPTETAPEPLAKPSDTAPPAPVPTDTSPPEPAPTDTSLPSPTDTQPPSPTPPLKPTPTRVLSSYGLISQGWNMAGGNASNSSWNAAEMGLRPPLKLAWEWSQPENFIIETMTVFDDIIYLGGSHAGDDNAMYAVRVGESAPLWSYRLTGARGGNGVQVAVEAGRAFFGGQQDDNLYCLDALTGDLLYTVPGTGGMYTRPPKIVKGRVYAPSSTGVMAIKTQNGNVLWNSDNGRVQSNNALIGALLLTGTYLSRIEGTMDVTAIDIQSGQVVWRTLEARAIRVAADQSRAYAVVSSANDSETFDTLAAYNLKDGSVAWQADLGWNVWYFSALAITDDMVFVAGSARDIQPQKLFALDKQTGAHLNQVDVAGTHLGTMAVANGVLYIGTREVLQAFDVSSFDLLWEKSLSVSDLAISDGRLFVATTSSVMVYTNTQ